MSKWITTAGWLLVALAGLLLGSNIARAQSANQVALVVQHADGTTYTQCIAFEEREISGFEVLLRADLELIYSGSGASSMVCKIGPDGCDSPGNCLCQCKGTDCKYWSYWHLVDGAWQYAQVGAGLYKVKHGTVEGWAWGIGTPSDAQPPPAISFEQVCAPPTPTPEPTPTAAATQTPTPTATAVTPAATPPPTAQPTATAAQTQTPAAPTPTPEPETAQGASWGSYAAFGGIVVVLVVVGIAVLSKK
jgi:hypothetical protein